MWHTHFEFIWSDILSPDADKHNVTVSKANLERLCKGTFLILLLGNHEDYDQPSDPTNFLWIFEFLYLY